MDIDHIKQHRNLTLEFGRGETYANGRPTLYGHSTYGRKSVLSGRPRRQWLEDWDDIETARALTAVGSTHIPVSVITAGLPDEDI